MSANWDREVDLVIVGSGAGAMAAAIRAADLGADVVLLEKSAHYGGSTAMSGGVCWVPANPQMAARNIKDSPEDALTYLKNIVGDSSSEERLSAYVKHSRRMLEYMHENTAVRFSSLEKYPDYYPEVKGGRPGGRSMESSPFDGAALGDEFALLHPPHPQSLVMGKMAITAREAHTLLANTWRGKVLMMWCLLLFALRLGKRKKFGRDTRLTAGNALAGRLRRSLMDRNVPILLQCCVDSLILDNGVVVGVSATQEGTPLRVRARRGVILAAGGFERNRAMREQYQPHPITDEWSAAHLDNKGAGIRMGLEAGGSVALMDDAWWTPTTRVPREELTWVIVVEKSLPHSIIVNNQGKRFTNEAAPYLDVVQGMYRDHGQSGGSIPAWLVFDANFRKKYPVGPLAPGYAVPDSRLSRRFREDFLIKAETLEELATRTGIDGAGLSGTVARFNGMVEKGEDTDFHRGKSLSDRYYGDPRVGSNPCLGSIVRGPFYAIKLLPGDLGTKGGLRTDAQARVLTDADQPIAGLFAVGNCSASVMGNTYPGAGGTIGPALTFGFVAAETAIGVPDE